MASNRTDEQYEIEALSKGLVVLEILVEEGSPVAQKRIVELSELKRDLVMRTLKTFSIRGYAVQNERGEWTVGPRFIRLATDVFKKHAF